MKMPITEERSLKYLLNSVCSFNEAFNSSTSELDVRISRNWNPERVSASRKEERYFNIVSFLTNLARIYLAELSESREKSD